MSAATDIYMDEAMQLDHLLETIPGAHIDGPANVEVTSIECDSRRIRDGSLFVAIRGGEEVDRHRFVADAVGNGASAVVVEDEVGGIAAVPRPTVVTVPNCRRVLGELAARFNGYPARQLKAVGVTGTNGKTTTSLLVRQILEAAGLSCGYLGTLGLLAGHDYDQMANTTPEACDLHDALRQMVEAGREAVAFEVSSHSLALGRVEGIEFDAAVFTNLTRDHLDFHGTESAYFEAKAALFDQLKRNGCGSRAVLNTDDAAGRELANRLAEEALTFGSREDAAVRLLDASHSGEGTDITLRTAHGEMRVHSQLTGAFNVANVVAAVACGIALGLTGDVIGRGISALRGVPGRFERIANGQGFGVIVDYAHTPAGLETVLRTAKELTEKRLICLFGCGGDRDVGKRPLMGKIATELADIVILTSDNPRSEPPEKIINDIAAGAQAAENVRVYPDRRAAIREALAAAGSGDMVVIAGKGDESTQTFADRTVDFDDREIAREVLRGMGWDGP